MFDENRMQADVYIDKINSLYVMSDEVKKRLADNKQLIQDRLKDYSNQQIVDAIEKYWKYKNDKTRPNLDKVLAQLNGEEKITNYANVNFCLSCYQTIDDAKKEYWNKYLNSDGRKHAINNGLEQFKLDNLMKSFVMIQIMIIFKPVSCKVRCLGIDSGLHEDLKKIKSFGFTEAKYESLFSYYRSREFWEAVKKRNYVVVDIPDDIYNYLLK